MKKAFLIDFDDSFTYNLVQELLEVGISCGIVHWKDIESLPEDKILVLGPGPGHPDDYQSLYPLLKNWLAKGLPFFGVCLGHQIFWRLQGEEVVRSKTPLHGQKMTLKLSGEWQEWLGTSAELQVQRYNSLAVPSQSIIRNPMFKNLICDDEVYITRGTNLITYQFHPESVGTTYRRIFFNPVARDLV